MGAYHWVMLLLHVVLTAVTVRTMLAYRRDGNAERVRYGAFLLALIATNMAFVFIVVPALTPRTAATGKGDGNE